MDLNRCIENAPVRFGKIQKKLKKSLIIGVFLSDFRI